MKLKVVVLNQLSETQNQISSINLFKILLTTFLALQATKASEVGVAEPFSCQLKPNEVPSSFVPSEFSLSGQSAHSLQFGRPKINKFEPNDQIAFKSICSGWKNSPKPAFWVLDKQRAALVAKFHYESGQHRTELREALLKSPVFPPVPSQHENNNHNQSCTFKFMYYKTTNRAHLELTIISSQLDLDTNRRIKPPVERTLISLNRTDSRASQSSEKSIWIKYQVHLDGLSKSIYQLQFDALVINPPPEDDNERATLNGIAIANFTLTQACLPPNSQRSNEFQLNTFDINDLKSNDPLNDLFHQQKQLNHHHNQLNKQHQQPTKNQQQNHFLLGNKFASRSSIGQFLDAHNISIFIGIILILVLIIITTQYILCAYLHQSQQHLDNSSDAQKQNIWWLPLAICCCCWCCQLNQFRYRQKRNKIYAHHDNYNQLDITNDIHLNKHYQNNHHHLRPLKDAFESVELNENSNYLNDDNLDILKDGCIFKDFQIDRSHLTLTKPLGKGAFGEVFQGWLQCYVLNDGDFDDDDPNQQYKKKYNFEDPDGKFDSLPLEVAVKTLTDERMSQSDFIREAIHMSQVRHHNIVGFVGVCFDEKPLYIVMELLKGGNLKNFLLKNRDKIYTANHNSPLVQLSIQQSGFINPKSAEDEFMLDEKKKKTVKLNTGDLLVFALDIARACNYLQKLQFVHRDLAARNCLLTASSKIMSNSPTITTTTTTTKTKTTQYQQNVITSPPSALDVDADHKVDIEKVYLNGFMNSGIVAKLSDFGMTRDVYTNNYYRTNDRELPVRWMPPESLDGVATSKSDVWSFGIFLWELFSMGQLPYQNLLNNHQVVEFIKSRHCARSRPPPTQQSNQDLMLTILNENDDITQVTKNGNESCPSTNISQRGTFEFPSVDSPPLPPPHDNTPSAVYAIMCACWATNPDDRPPFAELANRLYWCLQRPEVLVTELPSFYEQAHTPTTLGAHFRCESRSAGAQNSQATQVTQLNW